MPRLKKPEKVDTVYFHETGTHIDIMQNRNDYTFFAAYQGEMVSHPQKAMMPQLVRDLYARLHVALDWTRMISIRCSDSTEHGIVKLSYGVKDFAVRPSDFRIMERSVGFGDDHWQRQDHGKIYTGNPTIWQSWYYGMVIPGVSSPQEGTNKMTSLSLEAQSRYLKLPLYGRGAAYLPYTDELRLSLKRIQEMIGKLHDELDRIVTTPEGNIALLNFSAANLLPAPADQDERDEAQTIKNWEAVDWQRDLEPEDSDDE